MNDKQGATSTGTVIAYVSIIIGVLYLFASLNYHRNAINNRSPVPGILFIVVGVVIIIFKAFNKVKER